MRNSFSIAVIPGDGIGTEVTAATLAIIDAAQKRAGGFSVAYDTMSAGASYYSETGLDIEPDGETRAGQADAIFLGAIGLPLFAQQMGQRFPRISDFVKNLDSMPVSAP